MLLRLALVALVTLVVAGCVSAADAQERISGTYFDMDDANTAPFGIWSNGTIMWVVDFTADKIFAYNMTDKGRVSSEDFARMTLQNAGISQPTGIWSDGTTMWVADSVDDKIYSFHMSSKTYDGTKDFSQDEVRGCLTCSRNDTPFGLWSDGTTMWVADIDDDKIYSYHMSNRTYDSTKDFDTLKNATNTDPQGLWSDGTTMWVLNVNSGANTQDKIYAYKMSDKSRDSTKDFDTLHPGNNEATGIWSDGTTMWVTNADHGGNNDRILAYKMPAPPTPPTPPPRVYVPPPDTSAPPPRVYVPPPDTTPPTIKSVERTGNATTTSHALTWNVKFSESVRVGLVDIHTNYTSIVNATIPDLGSVSDAILMDIPGTVTGGSVSVDLEHFITGGLLIELVAPDCNKFTIHNQTTTFPYKLRQPYDLGDLSGIGAAGQWELHVSDHAKYWNGTLNSWTLYLESRGAIEGGGRTYTITQYVAGPGEYTLSLDGYNIRDWAGNRLKDTEPAVNEPYQVVGAAVRTCQVE